MVRLIPRCPEFAVGYREYCQELFDNHVTYFIPTNPATIDDGWFLRTKSWYDRKERGEVPGYPVSFHYWAVDGEDFIGEFQLRPEYTEKVLQGIGNVGYAVRCSRQRQGYGRQILALGLDIARKFGMERVMLNIHAENTASRALCE